MPNGAFNTAFEPVARPGGYVQFNDVVESPVYAIRAYNVLPEIPLEDNFDLADGGEEKRELTEIEMDDGFLAQYRLLRLPEEVPDGVEIEVDHDGRQSPLYQTKNVRGVLTNETGTVYTDDTSGGALSDAQLSGFSELFVWGANPPYFTVSNSSGGAVNFGLTFSGYAFQIERVAPSLDSFNGPQPAVVPIKSITN